VALLGVFLARTFTEPVHQLIQGAETISGGSLDYRIPVDVRDEIGQLAGAFNEMADNLRRSLQEIWESEKKFRGLLETAPDGIVVVNSDGHIVLVNPQTEKVFGYSRDELLGKPVEILMPERFREVHVEHRQGYCAHPITRPMGLDLALVGRRKDGSEFPADISLSPLEIEGRAFVMSLIRDITKRKQVEEALRDSEKRYRDLAETARDIIFALSGDGIIISLNPAFETITGWLRTEWIGKPFEAMVHPDDLPHTMELFQRVLQGEAPPLFEARILSKSGELVIVELTATLQVRDGKMISVLGIARDITERKRIEQERQEKEAWYRMLLEKYPDGVALSVEDKVVYTNPTLCEMAGYTVEEMVGRSPVEFIIQEDRERVIQRIRELLAGGPEYPSQYQVVKKDGSHRAIEVISRCISHDGKPTLLSIIRDITARKRAEEALRERTEALTEERNLLRTLIDNLPDYIFIKDPESRFVVNNVAHLHVLRAITQDEVAGKTDFDIFPRELAEQYYADEQMVIRSGTPLINREETTIDPEGRQQWLLTTKVPVRNSQGQIVGLVGMSRNITTLKQTEAALRESEARYRAIFDRAALGIGRVDLEGRTVESNRALQEMLGYSAGELQSMSFVEFTHPDDAQKDWDLFQELITGQRDHFQMEKRFIQKDGRLIWVNLTSSLVRDAAGHPQFAFGMAEDITARKQAEEELKQAAAELTRSNAELEQFAYVASHDLQEPLRMVTSYLQLLERRYQGQLDEKADKFIAYAVEGAARMQTLIQELLAYSRVGTRGQPFAPTDCQAVAEAAVANLGAAIQESGAVVIRAGLPTVLADATQLTQVFQNLIGNAIKFRRAAPPQIHVGAEREKGAWVFRVRDNGIGIAPEFTERIFVIFQRLHSRDEYPGTGMGLAICKKIVERHGGRIWVESEPGQGSTFYFTLPDRGGIL
jgi:PAS domain S-box-containing protein